MKFRFFATVFVLLVLFALYVLTVNHEEAPPEEIPFGLSH